MNCKYGWAGLVEGGVEGTTSTNVYITLFNYRVQVPSTSCISCVVF